MQINIGNNYKKLTRSLDETGRRQPPFAFFKTLKQTMKAVEKYKVARTYPRSFDILNKSFFAASMFKGGALDARKSVYRPWRRPRGVLGGGSISRETGNASLRDYIICEQLLKHRRSRRRKQMGQADNPSRKR